MKNKILLASATLLSALMVAACGNGEKKATETVAAPTTTAQTTTTGVSSDAKESLKIGSRTKLKIANNNSNILQQTNTMYYQ